MSTKQPYPRAKNLEVFSLAQELTRFRKHLEAEAGEPIQNIEINAALFLSDLCLFLGLGKMQHDMVLGFEALGYLMAVMTTPVNLAGHKDEQNPQ